MQTQGYRRRAAVIWIILWIFGIGTFSMKAQATESNPIKNEEADTEQEGSSQEAVPVIAAISDRNGQPVKSSYAVTIPANDDSEFVQLMYSLISLTARLEDGSSAVLWVNDWVYPMEGLDVPGKYSQTVSIPAENYRLSEGISQTITIEITVTEAVIPEPDVVSSFEDLSKRYAYAVARDSDWQEFWDARFDGGVWDSAWICYTESGEMLYADIQWENPEPDMSQIGKLTIRGTAVLPEHAVLAQGVTLPVVEVPVSIQAEPRLECWSADADVVYVPWIMSSPEQEAGLRFLATVDGGEWTDASEWMDSNGESVCVWIDYLQEGSTYEIKVVWDGGETNSFAFTWDGAVTDAGPVEGDRDGGDANGNAVDDVSQEVPVLSSVPKPESGIEAKPEAEALFSSEPELKEETVSPSKSQLSAEPVSSPESQSSVRSVPSPEEPSSSGAVSPEESERISSTKFRVKSSSPSSTPQSKEMGVEEAVEEAFFEEVTETYSLLSGARLQLMREMGPLRFSKQGVTITLSDTALENMALSADSRFMVRLQKEEQGFILETEVDGVPLTELPDTQVLFPFTASVGNGSVFLQNEEGEILGEGRYDPESGFLSFLLQAPGHYRIVEGEEKPDERIAGGEGKMNYSVLLPAALTLSISGLAAGLFFFRRRLG